MQYSASLLTKIKCDLFSPSILMPPYTYYATSNILLISLIIFELFHFTHLLLREEKLLVILFNGSFIDSTNEMLYLSYNTQ